MFQSIRVFLACLLLPLSATAASNEDEALIKSALAHARTGGFDLRVYKYQIIDTKNFFESFARAAERGDKQESLYLAQDALTKNFQQIRGELRSTEVNNLMVYLQMGVIGGLLKKYGSPASGGQQGAELVYSSKLRAPGAMSNEDACALSTSFSIFANSLRYSSIEDKDVFAAYRFLDQRCQEVNFQSCEDIVLDRRHCDGAGMSSLMAELIVNEVNHSW